MSNETFVYRIRVAGEQGPVRVQIRDPEDENLGEPQGKFSYARYCDQIQVLTQKLTDGTTVPLPQKDIQQLGEALFNCLFDEALRTNFLNTYTTVVHDKGSLLRVEIEIDEGYLPALAALPWEYLRAPLNQVTGPIWLATAPRLIFARTRDLAHPTAPLTRNPGEKVRVALAVATTDTLDLPPLGHDRIVSALQELVHAQPNRFELLQPVAPATRRTIDQLLEQEPHIFHLIAHGVPPNGGPGKVALIGKSAQVRWVDAEEFGNLFNRHRPGIVVLHVPHAAAGSSEQGFTGVASQVVQQNVRVVIGLRHNLTNAIAEAFSVEFYRRLGQGKPVDEAVQEGRYAISDFHETPDFGAPVLFTRVRNGQVFLSAAEIAESDAPALRRAQDLVLICWPFKNHKQLLAFFDTPKLRPWRGEPVHFAPISGTDPSSLDLLWLDGVLRSYSPAKLVDSLINFLRDEFHPETQENALVLFLETLSRSEELSRLEKQQSGCREMMARLAVELRQELQTRGR